MRRRRWTAFAPSVNNVTTFSLRPHPYPHRPQSHSCRTRCLYHISDKQQEIRAKITDEEVAEWMAVRKLDF